MKFKNVRQYSGRLAKTLRTLSHKKTSTKGSPEARILVFALYKKEASRVEATLRKHGYSVGALHGDMSQSARMDALERFKTGETGLLVATDVAARGLDIPNVGAVINYTFPLTIEDYIHRIGRTGESPFYGLRRPNDGPLNFPQVEVVATGNRSRSLQERITNERSLASWLVCSETLVSTRWRINCRNSR